MRGNVRPSEWTPIGVPSLEPAALDVVHSRQNMLVVAGPGAGKTELLAQRACFLLQTGRCPFPRRILAISFKRDAARNLSDRVKLRCGSDLASRFHSYTFDAFAKNLVDRFGQALPDQFRPTRDYKINFELTKWAASDWINQSLPTQGSTLSPAVRARINGIQFYEGPFVGQRLSLDRLEGRPPIERAAAELWRYMLKGDLRSEMNFHMIGRLAELILRRNPKILAALRAAYAYVFLDEFQDTSSIHYDLAVTAFRGTTTVVTAVGDNKQRVNKWAGALDGIFDRFEQDFASKRTHLLFNYRSAPELVRVQSFVAAAIDPNAPAAQAAMYIADGKPDGECLSLIFTNYEVEARELAKMIKRWIKQDALSPRDVCILTRQRPEHYAKLLQAELLKANINSRVENSLQDLVAEPLTIYVVHMLRLAASNHAPQSWGAIVDLLAQLQGELGERFERRMSRKFSQFVVDLRTKLVNLPTDPCMIETLLDEIIGFFGTDEFKAEFQQYAQGDFFAKTRRDIAQELASRFARLRLSDALDDLEGVGAIPIMTMHKSKGLEYHTVIFIGLEDAALKGFNAERDEETCGFFVALSRAKMRAVFTFSERRPTYNVVQIQKREAINPLYDILKAAGIEPQHVA
ncbi:hypothetical protein BON30_04930 [Cystobacter ferrugineus]|uniref:DNA 3'-5' helicase n=2 Tax=Cystobacter ferrugineus TaxID=83449 RepID=A0A1L9BL25_9BACT|nr:ATP-dependent helicase [Cystobacter ferrugineus]OJH42929.1 hypothetical protein BON30_04930 [Cystobacter ferrugineus]